MKYKVITGICSDFSSSVNSSLSNGWELYGNPFYIGEWRGSVQYGQAVIKHFTDPFVLITGSEGMICAEMQEYKKYGYEKLSEPIKTGEMIEFAGKKHPEYISILKKIIPVNTTCSVRDLSTPKI